MPKVVSDVRSEPPRFAVLSVIFVSFWKQSARRCITNCHEVIDGIDRIVLRMLPQRTDGSLENQAKRVEFGPLDYSRIYRAAVRLSFACLNQRPGAMIIRPV